MSEPQFTVEQIPAARTHELRRSVLRDGAPEADVVWPGDDAGDTIHLAALDGTRVVAISTWLWSPDPEFPDRRGVQLRGMATDPAYMGLGFGTRLLRAGLEESAARKADIVWANARVSALTFYERNGFEVIGPVFTTADTGLAHRRVRIPTPTT